MTKAKRVALYVRVSTDDQTVENQKRELQAWAERCGHGVVKVFEDRGISGSKGRDKRPGFDAMLKAAVRREFDMLAVWSSDRLGRSLQHLIEVLQTIRDMKSFHISESFLLCSVHCPHTITQCREMLCRKCLGAVSTPVLMQIAAGMFAVLDLADIVGGAIQAFGAYGL